MQNKLTRLAATGLAVITVTLAVGMELSQAQREPRPWCLQSSRGGPGGGLPDCSYYSFTQCRASIGGGGDGCFMNPALGWDRIEGKRVAPSRGR